MQTHTTRPTFLVITTYIMGWLILLRLAYRAAVVPMPSGWATLVRSCKPPT